MLPMKSIFFLNLYIYRPSLDQRLWFQQQRTNDEQTRRHEHGDHVRPVWLAALAVALGQVFEERVHVVLAHALQELRDRYEGGQGRTDGGAETPEVNGDRPQRDGLHQLKTVDPICEMSAPAVFVR